MLWVSRHIANSSGVHVLEARNWDPDSADLTFYTDTCLTGLAFWIPSEKVGFCADVPTDRRIPSKWIFYREVGGSGGARLCGDTFGDGESENSNLH